MFGSEVQIMPVQARWAKLHKRPAERAWHPEHVKAACRAKGMTLAAIAARLGVTATAVGTAIRRPTSRRIDRAIARVIGVHPRQIWPDRYPAAKRQAKEAA